MDPAVWGSADNADYKDYPKYEGAEEALKDLLVARMPANNDVYMKDNEKIMQFKTSNDPNVDIWFRASSSHSPRSRIQWRHVLASLTFIFCYFYELMY